VSYPHGDEWCNHAHPNGSWVCDLLDDHEDRHEEQEQDNYGNSTGITRWWLRREGE